MCGMVYSPQFLALEASKFGPLSKGNFYSCFFWGGLFLLFVFSPPLILVFLLHFQGLSPVLGPLSPTVSSSLQTPDQSPSPLPVSSFLYSLPCCSLFPFAFLNLFMDPLSPFSSFSHLACFIPFHVLVLAHPFTHLGPGIHPAWLQV